MHEIRNHFVVFDQALDAQRLHFAAMLGLIALGLWE